MSVLGKEGILSEERTVRVRPVAIVAGVTVSAGLLTFLVGAIFWAGAAYARLQGMEGHLDRIEKTISTFSDTQGTVKDNTREIERLRRDLERHLEATTPGR